MPVFGLPVGPLQQELVEGRPLQVQWFERNRLELHPEYARPYDVLLGRLGVDRLAEQGRRDWQNFPTYQSRWWQGDRPATHAEAQLAGNYRAAVAVAAQIATGPVISRGIGLLDTCIGHGAEGLGRTRHDLGHEAVAAAADG